MLERGHIGQVGHTGRVVAVVLGDRVVAKTLESRQYLKGIEFFGTIGLRVGLHLRSGV